MKKNINGWISMLLILTPFIDSINGIYMIFHNENIDFSPGQMLRIPIILVIIFYCVKKYKGLIIISAFFSIFLLQQLFLALNYGMNFELLMKEGILFSKIIFMISLIILLISNIDKINVGELINSLIDSVIIISIIIIATKILGIGVSTYSSGLGNKGFFIEQNAISLILVSSISLIIDRIYNEEKKFKYIIYYILVGISCILVSTRVGIFGFILMSSYSMLFLKVNNSKRKKTKLILAVLMIVASTSAIILFRDKFDTAILIERYRYFIERLDIVSFIFSDRNNTLIASFDNFSSNTLFLFLGTGLNYGALVEMDLFDILFFYGIIITSIVFAILSYPVIKSLVSIKVNKALFISYIFFLSVSILSGHVFFTAISATYFSVIYSLCYKLIKDYRK